MMFDFEYFVSHGALGPSIQDLPENRRPRRRHQEHLTFDQEATEEELALILLSGDLAASPAASGCHRKWAINRTKRTMARVAPGRSTAGVDAQENQADEVYNEPRTTRPTRERCRQVVHRWERRVGNNHEANPAITDPIGGSQMLRLLGDEFRSFHK
jgi:hypothetical protein